MKAFINQAGVLTAYGFMDSNGDDQEIDVPDDFSYPLNETKWNGTAWVPYSAPMDWPTYQSLARSLLTDSDITILRCVENAVQVPVEWASYRKALRKIVGAETGDSTAALPVKPAYPAGT